MAEASRVAGLELLTWLRALREVSAASTSGTDVHHVLNLIADTARELLGFDFVGVLTPDSAGKNLLIAGWSGLSAEYVAQVNTERPIGVDSGSPSGRAFRSGQPVALRDITDEPEFVPWGGVAREQGYRAIACVPLVAGDDVLGTLNGYYTPVHTFTGTEIERLSLLANHAAIALTSASRLDQLRQLNESLRRQRDTLSRSEQIHERLLAVTLRSGGLHGIATVLAELIDRPVLIDDAHDGVLASTGEIAELPEESWRVHTVISPDAGSTPHLVDVEGDKDPEFFVSVARLDQEVAARVWFPAGESALDAIGVRAVEHASIVVSLELLRLRTAAEVENHLRGELLADLLNSGSTPSEQLIQRAQRLGHDLSRSHVAMVSTLNGSGQAADSHAYRRALAQISNLLTPNGPRPLTAMHRGDIVTMWPVDDTPDAESTSSNASIGDAAASVYHAMMAATGLPATVAVSPRHPSTYAQAYRIAKGALDVAVRAGRTNTVVQLRDLGVVGLLLQVDDSAALADFAAATLGPLMSYDDSHHTDLVTTLRTYFASRLDRGVTAAALHVHPNTVTQRLRRIAALCEVDLADPLVMVTFSAALTVQEVTSAG